MTQASEDSPDLDERLSKRPFTFRRNTQPSAHAQRQSETWLPYIHGFWHASAERVTVSMPETPGVQLGAAHR